MAVEDTWAGRKRRGPDMPIDTSGQYVLLHYYSRASVSQASCLHDGILALSEAEVQMLIKPQLQHCGYRLREHDKIPGNAAAWVQAFKLLIFMPDHAQPGFKARR